MIKNPRCSILKKRLELSRDKYLFLCKLIVELLLYDVIKRSKIKSEFPKINLDEDRVEIYRPLMPDPKQVGLKRAEQKNRDNG